MESDLKADLTPEILDSLASRFGVRAADLQPIEQVESFLYGYEAAAGPRILRVSHSGHRTADLVEAEVAWIHHLAQHGVPVAAPLPSRRGRLAEVCAIARGGHFTAVSFARAPGGPPRGEAWNGDLHRSMGRVMGRMHALTRHYQPAGHRRPRWDADVRGQAQRFLPPEDAGVFRRWNEVLDRLSALPTPEDGYGLVHFDFHRANFFVDRNGSLTLFDFDDCQYAWFVADIAIAIFYAAPIPCSTAQDIEDVRAFYRNFMAGYSAEYALDGSWLAHIPLFLKFRELDLYMSMFRLFQDEPLDPWGARFMAGRRERLLDEVPYMDLDFRQELPGRH